jgi:hypothetical protein
MTGTSESRGGADGGADTAGSDARGRRTASVRRDGVADRVVVSPAMIDCVGGTPAAYGDPVTGAAYGDCAPDGYCTGGTATLPAEESTIAAFDAAADPPGGTVFALAASRRSVSDQSSRPMPKADATTIASTATPATGNTQCALPRDGVPVDP